MTDSEVRKVILALREMRIFSDTSNTGVFLENFLICKYERAACLIVVLAETTFDETFGGVSRLWCACSSNRSELDDAGCSFSRNSPSDSN